MGGLREKQVCAKMIHCLSFSHLLADYYPMLASYQIAFLPNVSCVRLIGFKRGNQWNGVAIMVI